MRSLVIVSLTLLLLAAGPLYGIPLSTGRAVAALRSPTEFLGHEVGSDRTLDDWDTIVRYIYHLTSESGRADVEELGVSTLGKPFLMVVLGDEETVTHRDRYQQIVQRLYDAGNTSAEQAAELAQDGKVLVALSLGLHSVEVGASQASMEMMYRLVTLEDPATKAIRENCLVLMVPSMNPDGLDIVVDWYRRTLGTAAEGSRPPWLYHHYAGHDNNRDGFFNNLAETALWSRMLYHDWMPQIILDEHQMGSRGPRLFLPPFDDPISPTVHRLVYSQLSAAGQHMVNDLTAQGWSGIATSTIFTAEWPGSVRSTGFWHNMLGILSEVASAELASPLYFPPGSVGGGGRSLPENERRANFVSPWPGGWWGLTDIVSLELDLTWSLLGWAANQKESLLLNFHAMNGEGIRRGTEEAPYGFVVGARQHDAGSAHRLAGLLMDGGIEVRWDDGPLEIEGRVHPDGAYLIDSSQPFRPFLLEMLDSPPYPMVRDSAAGEVVRPYDVTAWSLPDLLGVEVQRLRRPATGDLGTIVHSPVRPGVDTGSGQLRLPASDNASYAVVNELLKQGAPVSRWVSSTAQVNAGDFRVSSGNAVESALAAHGGRALVAPGRSSQPDTAELRTPRLGIYAPWGGSMDEGWTRWLFDRYGFSYERIRVELLAGLAEDRRGGARLLESFDSIVLPSIPAQRLETGRQPSEPENTYAPVWPEEYRGGLGKAGAGALFAEYVKAGGTLVVLDQSCSWVLDQLGLPANEVLHDADRDEFYAPGSLLAAEVDPEHPLAWGMPAQVAVYFARGRAFTPIAWSRPTTVPVRYADSDVGVAGFVTGADRIEGLPGMVDIPMGQGHVVLFGFKPQHRGQTEATFKLLFNALLNSGLQRRGG